MNKSEIGRAMAKLAFAKMTPEQRTARAKKAAAASVKVRREKAIAKADMRKSHDDM